MSATIEEIRERKRLYMAKKRASDPEAARAYHRERHKKNREHNVAKMRAYYARRFFWGRAMKLRGSHRATASDLASIWKQQRGRCALTGRRLDRSAQLDHIVARASVKMHDGTFSVARPMVFEPTARGSAVPAFAAIEFEEAQRLMDALWQAGVRPTDGTGSTGQLAATQAHLADMRKLVFERWEPTMVRA